MLDQDRHLATGDYVGGLAIWDLENMKKPIWSPSLKMPQALIPPADFKRSVSGGAAHWGGLCRSRDPRPGHGSPGTVVLQVWGATGVPSPGGVGWGAAIVRYYKYRGVQRRSGTTGDFYDHDVGDDVNIC